MAARRPNLSITLPRNFTFHAQDGGLPKTPEHVQHGELLEQPQPVPPHASQRFRIRRRTNSKALPSDIFASQSAMTGVDIPVPTIEEPPAEDWELFHSQQSHDDPMNGFLSPLSSQPYSNAPITPLAQMAGLDGPDWSNARQQFRGDAIARPASQCSDLSNSSGESDASSAFFPSSGTTCTSPERNPSDPFMSPTKDDKECARLPFAGKPHPEPSRPQQRQRMKTQWTPAMDNHLWTTYQLYLQDPTVTPIKTLPGSIPPLGVCHRVARQAKQTWRDSKAKAAAKHSAARFSTPQPGLPRSQVDIESALSDNEMPTMAAHVVLWPKPSATRRRLRELSKRRASIAPHYIRLIQSRSPSPFAPELPQVGRRIRGTNPFSPKHRKAESLSTRDIQLALTTSTSETMQPDGPLAHWQRDSPRPGRADISFSDPPVPWASPAPAPSSEINDQRSSSIEQAMRGTTPPPPAAPQPRALAHEQPSRLGSPFAPHSPSQAHQAHSWGPIRTRPRVRPPLGPSTVTSDALPSSSAITPSSSLLRSPIRLHDGLPHPGGRENKRRAQLPLDDEAALADLFGPPLPSGQRRVRSRGFSLGDALARPPPAGAAWTARPRLAAATLQPGMVGGPFVDAAAAVQPSTRSWGRAAVRQLGSPFAGIGDRPARGRGARGHVPSASLSAFESGVFGSIGERLGR